MASFILLGFDKPDSLALRTATRPAHLAYLATQGSAVRLAGPLLDEAGAVIGSMFLLEVPSLAAAHALNAADPYTVAGLWARVEAHGFRQTIPAP